MVPPEFRAHLVVLCFDRRCLKQNTVARLESKYLAAPKILGWLRYCLRAFIEQGSLTRVGKPREQNGVRRKCTSGQSTISTGTQEAADCAPAMKRRQCRLNVDWELGCGRDVQRPNCESTG